MAGRANTNCKSIVLRPCALRAPGLCMRPAARARWYLRLLTDELYRLRMRVDLLERR